ncbi:MAG: AraC family transcriptional regulator, partial [Bacteroidota bacterium]
MDDLIFFSYNEKSSVLLIFFFNAMVFSYLLLQKSISESKKDSRWLAAFIFLGGLYICPFMLGYAGWYTTNSYAEFLFFVPFQQLFLLGPVFFFYVKTLLNSNSKLNRKDIIHFLPAIIYLIYSLIVFIGDKFIFEEFYFYADRRDKDLDFWYQISGLISMLFYLFMSLKHYLNYRKISLQEVSFADEIAFRWIKHFTIAFGLILVLRILFFILNPEWGEFGSKYWYYLCFSILLFYISITGYSNTIKTSIKLNAAPLLDFERSEEKRESEAKNEVEASMDFHEWKHKITQLFETEEVYKNPNLTLTDLANLLNTNRNII